MSVARSSRPRAVKTWRRSGRDDCRKTADQRGGRARANSRLPGAKRPRRREPAGRAADRRRVGSALLPRAQARRAVVRARALRGAVRRPNAAVRQRRHADGEDAGAGSRGARPRRRSRRRWRSKISATSRCRRISARRRRRNTRHCIARRWRSSTRCSAAAPTSPRRLPALRHRVRRREADLGAGVLHQALPRGVSRRRSLAGGERDGAQRGVARDRRRARRANRACCAIATITAAT